MREGGLFLAFFLCLLSGAGGEERFDWPVDLPPALSSTFGETRSTAFHAGIDVKTWGRTGYAVKAVGRGYVFRLRTSPWGYGRAVYQRLEDGRIVVYAHLSGFAPRLSDRVEAAQREAGRYSVDLWFGEKELPLRRGERIGWSGCSGSGPPHLHLELRDAQNAPVNPLLFGFEVEDHIAPTLRSVAFFPMGIRSWVQEGHAPFPVGLRRAGGGNRFSAEAPVRVCGRIGVGVLEYDRADAASNRLAPYSVRLRVDGRPVFSRRFVRFSYGDAHQIYLDRTRLASGDFFHLFRLPGNRLSFYEGGDGFLFCGTSGGLEKGTHEVEVLSRDVAGNESRAGLLMQVDAPPRVVEARLTEGTLECRVADPDDPHLEVELACSEKGEEWEIVDRRRVGTASGRLRWRLDREASLWRVRARDPSGAAAFMTCAPLRRRPDPAGLSLRVERKAHPGFVELIVRADRFLVRPPRVQADGRDLEVRQEGLREYRIDVPLRTGGPEWLELRIEGTAGDGARAVRRLRLNQRPVRPGAAARLAFDGGKAELFFPEGSAYAVFFPQAGAFRPPDSGELIGAGLGYAFAPEGLSFDRKVEVRFRYPPNRRAPEKLGIYRPSEDGSRWVLVGNEVEVRTSQVRAVVRRLSRLALMADETPPSIRRLRPAPGEVVPIRRPRLTAWIDDRGSGIGREEDVVMELDGRRLISEYDPDGKKVEYLVRRDLAPGAHLLVVRVRDMSGNQAEVRSEFTVE